MAARRFTPGEDQALLLSRDEMGCGWPAIEGAFRRKAKDLKTRYDILIERRLMPPPVLVGRSCLRCLSPFQSEGPSNRVCEPCREKNSHVHTFGGAPLHMADGPGLVFGRGYPATPGSPR